MKEILYEFVDLDSVESFVKLGNAFGGEMRNGRLFFNTEAVTGEIFMNSPEPGLWIRKWKLTVCEKIVLRKRAGNPDVERKYCLVYFLNPSIFSLKKDEKGIVFPTYRNNVFFSSNTMMEFSVVPKQPFYVLDLAFTEKWLLEQMDSLDPKNMREMKCFFADYNTSMSLLPCSVDEYTTLRELEVLGETDQRYDSLFIRSRVYKLISEFFQKILKPDSFDLLPGVVHYDQVMEAEKIVMSDLKHLQPIQKIAVHVGLSASTLLRQFRNIFGKNIEEYYIAKKMEMAKTLIARKQLSIKEIAGMFGYRQVSAFIQIFTKAHGYSPGTLKYWRNQTD